MLSVIIIRGKTGSGKTTLARKLGKKLCFKVIEVDDYKVKNTNFFEGVGNDANEVLSKGTSIIIVEAFLDKKHVEKVFKKIENCNGYNILSVLLKCNKNIARKRKSKLKISEIEYQHTRQVKDINDLLSDDKNEFCVNTDAMTESEVFRRVLEWVDDKLN